MSVSQRTVGSQLFTLERDEDEGDPAMPWKVYAITVLPNQLHRTRGTRVNHARVSNNANPGDIWDAPYDNLDATLQEATERCARSNGDD